jgi:preprotein translocase subunit SecG
LPGAVLPGKSKSMFCADAPIVIRAQTAVISSCFFIVCFFLQILAAKVRKKKHYEVYNHSIMVEKTSKGLVKREKSTNFAHDISEE